MRYVNAVFMSGFPLLERDIFVPQLVVGPPLLQQLRVGAPLRHLAPVDDEDLVRVDDGGESAWGQSHMKYALKKAQHLYWVTHPSAVTLTLN